MPRVLIQLAHPALDRSRVHIHLLRVALGIEDVTVNDLYANYPDGVLDVSREQNLLEQHQVVVFQHPLYWYSCPALLKEWMDLVMEYGSDNQALAGRDLLSVITTGDKAQAYCCGDDGRYLMLDLLSPFRQAARHCGMRYLPAWVIHGTGQMRSEGEALSEAEHYRSMLQALVAGRLDLDSADPEWRMNMQFDKLLREPAAEDTPHG